MQPHIKLASSKTSDGTTIALYEHDGKFSIYINGQGLMHSKASASERRLGQLGVTKLESRVAGRVLIGGLGLGFTLQSVLESVGRETTVEVVELIPDVIQWNRVYLKQLNGSLLEDPRVEIRTGDVTRFIRKAEPGTYDAILLDVDNGPVAMVTKKNSALYSISGIRLIRSALKTGGRAVFWSAGLDLKFETRLRKAGFKVNAVVAKVHEKAKRAAYLLYIADLGTPEVQTSKSEFIVP
jgi:spermidine synthase